MAEIEERRRFKRVGEKERRLARKLQRQMKDIEEVSKLPKLVEECDENGDEIDPPPRFWEVWSPDAPKPNYISTKCPDAPMATLSVIMSSVRAPMLVEEMIPLEDNGLELVMKLIPGSETLGPEKIPVDSYEAQFPSRRGGVPPPRARFAPRLIFPCDVENVQAREDEIFTIGEDFKPGDRKVTERPPSQDMFMRNESRGSLNVMTKSLLQEPRKSSGDEPQRQRSTNKVTEVSKTPDRTLSLGNVGEERTKNTSRMSAILLLKPRHKEKPYDFVRIPPINQEQWVSIQHTYNRVCPPPTPISRQRRINDSIKALPNAFQLLHDMRGVELLPDIAGNYCMPPHRVSSETPGGTYQRVLKPPFRPSAGSSKQTIHSAKTSIDTRSRSGSIRSHRHSSILYYVDPAVPRPEPIVIEEEESDNTSH